jgi:hypothetical protein
LLWVRTVCASLTWLRSNTCIHRPHTQVAAHVQRGGAGGGLHPEARVARGPPGTAGELLVGWT